MDLRGHWSSVCPALLRYPRRNQVAPDFCVAGELSHRWGPHPSPLPQAGEGSLLLRLFPASGRGCERSERVRGAYFGAPSPASIITSSFSPALLLRRKAPAPIVSFHFQPPPPPSNSH